MHALVARLIPDRRRRWALSGGGAAALCASIVDGLNTVSTSSYGRSSFLLAALIVFIIVTPLLWSVLTPVRGPHWRRTAACVGILCGFLPPPPFIIAWNLLYERDTPYLLVNIMFGLIVSLLILSPLTAIAGAVTTIALVGRYGAPLSTPAAPEP